MNITEAKANMGKLVHVTDGTPKPPERFNKKLATWKHTNFSGKLVEITPPWDIGESHQCTIMTANRGYMVVNHSGYAPERISAGEHPLAPADLTVKANAK